MATQLRHNRHLGQSARSAREIDHHEAVFYRAQARERRSLYQQSNLPKATIDIALVTSESGQTAYGAVVTFLGAQHELSASPATTPQRTALLAVEASLRALQPRHDVTLQIVCDYVVESMTQGYAQRWARHGWRTKAGAPVQSRDLWQKILAHCVRHVVAFQYPPLKTSWAMMRAEALAAKALHQSVAAASEARPKPQPTLM